MGSPILTGPAFKATTLVPVIEASAKTLPQIATHTSAVKQPVAVQAIQKLLAQRASNPSLKSSSLALPSQQLEQNADSQSAIVVQSSHQKQPAQTTVAQLSTAAEVTDLPSESSDRSAPGTTTWLSTHAPWLHRALQGVTFAVVIKALCMTGNVLVQVSPYPTVKRWQIRQNTGEADAAPYVSIAFGGWQWCFYGMFAYLITNRNGFLILVQSNCLGAVLGTYYTFAFSKNCQNTRALLGLQKYLSAAGALVFFQACSCMILPKERALFLAGLVSSFCSFVGAFSTLITVPLVIRTQDTRSIPGPLVLANFCASCVWVLCGWMLRDMLVMVPCMVSACVNFTCCCLKATIPSNDSNEKESEDAMLDAVKSHPRLHVSEQTPLMQSVNNRLPDTAENHATPDVEAPCSSGLAGTGGT